VTGFDETLAQLGDGGGIVVALLVALLLGLRHATDPDHLTAVSTLVLSDDRRGGRRASTLGLFWGLGHATTLTALGLPIVLLGGELPAQVGTVAEVGIGVLIMVLAVRLLVRWRRGYFHAHPHDHGGRWHAHPHVHERRPRAAHEGPDHQHAPHAHKHPDTLGRSPLASFGIGLAHGVGGSAGAAVLLIALVPEPGYAVVALLCFAAATALSMALCSSAFGYVLARGPVARRLAALAPAFGLVGVVFGAWYVLGAVELAPYVF
jgi:ABC-type nickel/cobalt efflux system permease component RcnA